MEPPTRNEKLLDGTIHPLTEAAKKRAEESDVTGQRCLIENCSSKRAIRLAHVYERGSAANNRRAAALEWSWKLQKNTLNLDTRRNIFFVGASVRVLYEQRRWALVPEEPIVYKYFDETREVVLPRKQFPDLQDETFRYNFIPTQRMEEVYLTHQTDLPDGGRNVDVYYYPFFDFPVITSQIDPKYAIAQLGSILTTDLDATERQKLCEMFPILEKIVTLYKAWTKTIPQDADNDETYVLPLEEDEFEDNWDESVASSIGDSIYTPKRRIRSKLVQADTPRSSPSPAAEEAPANTENTPGNSDGASSAEPSGPSEDAPMNVEQEPPAPAQRPAQATRATRGSKKRALEEVPEAAAVDKAPPNKRRKAAASGSKAVQQPVQESSEGAAARGKKVTKAKAVTKTATKKTVAKAPAKKTAAKPAEKKAVEKTTAKKTATKKAKEPAAPAPAPAPKKPAAAKKKTAARK